MAERRDTEIDIEPPDAADWDKPTPKVIVPAPDDPFLRGAMDAHNTWYAYLQTDTWKLLGDDGKPRRITAAEAADIVQTVRNLQGV